MGNTKAQEQPGPTTQRISVGRVPLLDGQLSPKDSKEFEKFVTDVQGSPDTDALLFFRHYQRTKPTAAQYLAYVDFVYTGHRNRHWKWREDEAVDLYLRFYKPFADTIDDYLRLPNDVRWIVSEQLYHLHRFSESNSMSTNIRKTKQGLTNTLYNKCIELVGTYVLGQQMDALASSLWVYGHRLIGTIRTYRIEHPVWPVGPKQDWDPLDWCVPTVSNAMVPDFAHRIR